MVGLQIMVTIQSGNRQEFLQAIDMLCSRRATYSDRADDYIFEAVDTPNRFFYLKQWTDRRLLDNFLKTDRFRALLGAIQVLGKLTTIRVLISHGGYCGRCYSCVNLLCQAMCTNIAGGEVGTSSAPPKFFIDGLAPIERKNDSKSGWAALAQYRLADEGTCTIIPDDLDFKYAIAAECSMGMAYCAQEFMKVKSGDYLLLLGNGQRQFSLSHVIVGLFRGARVIAAVRDDYQAERVRAIGKARGGTPDLHIIDMRSPDWKDKVRALSDGNGPEKVADFTSEEEVLNAALDLLCVQGVLYIQENLYNKNRKLSIDPYAQLAEKNLTITATIDSRHIDRPGIIRMLRNKEVQRMWDEVATHEFSMTEVDKAMELTVTQKCGKVLVYPHRH